MVKNSDFHSNDLLCFLCSFYRSTRVERLTHLGGAVDSPRWNERLTRVTRLNDCDKKRKTLLSSDPFMLYLFFIFAKIVYN